ncbi:hypothetical protein G9A89_000701 [Geosiphon pyriformis]|nr:hypothetical protein G9A89_000701 [Geosiphon pyriformis]
MGTNAPYGWPQDGELGTHDLGPLQHMECNPLWPSPLLLPLLYYLPIYLLTLMCRELLHPRILTCIWDLSLPLKMGLMAQITTSDQGVGVLLLYIHLLEVKSTLWYSYTISQNTVLS